jgi:hypothetical protein
MAEQIRVAIRNIRRDANDDLKKSLKTANSAKTRKRKIGDEVQSSPTNTSEKSTRNSKLKKKKSWKGDGDEFVYFTRSRKPSPPCRNHHGRKWKVGP